jgi:flagellar motor switch protein FliG
MSAFFELQTIEKLTGPLDNEIKSLIYILMPETHSARLLESFTQETTENFITGCIELMMKIPETSDLETLKESLNQIINEINWFLEKKRSSKVLEIPVVEKLSAKILEMNKEKAINILNIIKSKNKTLYSAVRSTICFFNEIPMLTNQSIKKFLRNIDPVVLATALKTESPELQKTILDNMDQESRTYLKEEMMFVDPGMREQIESAQKDCRQVLSELITHGDIDIPEKLINL